MHNVHELFGKLVAYYMPICAPCPALPCPAPPCPVLPRPAPPCPALPLTWHLVQAVIPALSVVAISANSLIAQLADARGSVTPAGLSLARCAVHQLLPSLCV